jgi:predicted CXXCH cytochrome family protein
LRQVDVEANCALCHAEAVSVVKNSGHSHRGVKGSCVACHDAHGSGEKGLLRESARASCLSCHEEIARVVGDAKVSHHPLLEGERCERCHDPHGSAFPGMLRFVWSVTRSR